jgi:imidazolonepropionase-like amidohydrolase
MLHKIIALILCLLTINQLDSPSPAQSWSISGVNIVDVETGSVASNKTVVIEKERIVAVRDANDQIDAAAINGKGLYLIPSSIATSVGISRSGTGYCSQDMELDLFATWEVRIVTDRF